MKKLTALALLVLVVSCGAQSEQAKKSAKATRQVFAKHGAECEFTVSDSDISAIERLQLTVKLSLKDGQVVDVEPAVDLLDDWLLVDRWASRPTITEGRLRHQEFRYRFDPLAVGAVKLPVLTWTILGPKGRFSLSSQALDVSVQSLQKPGVQAKEPAPQFDLTSDETQPEARWPWWKLLVVVLGLGLLAAWTFFAPKAPTQSLKSAKSWESELDHCRLQLSEDSSSFLKVLLCVYRDFLSHKFEFKAQGMSRQEIAEALSGRVARVQERELLLKRLSDWEQWRFTARELTTDEKQSAFEELTAVLEGRLRS